MALAQQTQRESYFYNDFQQAPAPVYQRPVTRDWWSEVNKLIFTLQTTRSQFFTTLTVQVFANRVTLTYKPYIGAGETVQTYNATDIGNVFANRGMRFATVGVYTKYADTPLFEVKRLKHMEAIKLKEALEKMIAFNQLTTFRR